MPARGRRPRPPRARATSSVRAGSRRAACSRSASWRCSASGRGSGWCRSLPSSSCSRRPRRSRSTTSRAGPGRRSSRSRSRSRSAPSGRRRRPGAIGAIPGRTRARGPAEPAPPARRRVAERWIRERQEADGSWGGIQPPWVWGIIALAALGHGLDDPTLGKAVEGWRGLHGRGRRAAEARGVPVARLGHRARAARAPRVRRVPTTTAQLVRAGEYLLSEEVRVKGDWAIRRPDLAPGGWAFEYENDNYPDVDDTAVLPLALHGMGIGEEGRDRARRSTGSSACSRATAAGARSTSTTRAMWLYKIPFCDFGKVTDEPSADVTAHSLETLGDARRPPRRGGARRRVAPLRAGGRRLVVRPLGRQPPLRHGRGAAGPRGMRDPARPPLDAPRRRLARLRAAGERRLRRGHPLLRRSRAGAAARISRRRRRRLGR